MFLILFQTNKKLREVTPDSTVAHLQEEMMAAKLREAEATFGMKELKQKVFDLELEFKVLFVIYFMIFYLWLIYPPPWWYWIYKLLYT